MMVSPWAFNLAKFACNNAIPCLSKLAVGSSKTKIWGRCIWAAANATRCFCPPESSASLADNKPASPNSCSVTLSCCQIRSGACPWFSAGKANSSLTLAKKNCRRGFWKTEPTWAAISSTLCGVKSCWLSVTFPCKFPGKYSGIKPFKTLKKVLLPLPLIPVKTTHRPAAISKWGILSAGFFWPA